MTGVLLQKNISLINEDIIMRAKYFLENAGEFFPFAATIDSKNELSSAHVYFGEERPSSQRVIDELYKALGKGLNSGEYMIAGIGLDIYLTDPEGKKSSAIEIRILNSIGVFTRFRISYVLDENQKFHGGDLVSV